VRVGGRLGFGVDGIRLSGRSNEPAVVTSRRTRWTPSAELVGRLAVSSRRLSPYLELGAHTPLSGLRAEAPDVSLEARGVVAILRLGLDVRLR
jgi:hypothetical protein